MLRPAERARAAAAAGALDGVPAAAHHGGVSDKSKKIDLWTEHKDIFRPSAKQPQLVKVPPLVYLKVDGQGDPNTAPAFQQAIGALYGLAYALKFFLKKRKGVDFRVMPLSGLFHADDPAVFLAGKKHEWKWTLMIPIPSLISAADVEKARAEAMARKKASPALPLVRRETVREGLCAQILHQGPYQAERPTIEGLHAFMREKGLTFSGPHHEIYISDPNRTAPEKLKTIIRQPVKKA